MRVVVREVATDDWKAVYLNNKKICEDHNVSIQDICEGLQNLLDDGNTINSIYGEYHYLNEDYAEEHGFPDKFSNIPEDMFE